MSVPYLGDFTDQQTVYMPFNTFSSDDPTASTTITDLADTDIHVHKDGGTTQTTTGATVAINYDGITGNHLITIVTTDAFYVTGSDYHVRIEGATVDGATAGINSWIGHFSIENRHSAGAVRPTTAGRTLDISSTGEAGIDWANVGSQSTSVNLSGTTTNLVNTVTTYTGNTLQTGDSFALIGTAGAGLTNLGASGNDWNTVVPDAAGVAPTTAEIATGVWQDTTAGDFTLASSIGLSVMNGVALGTGLTIVSVSGSVGSLTGHTNQTADHTAGIADIPTVAEFNARTQPTADYFDWTTDTVANVTNVATLTGHTVQTGDTYALANGTAGFVAIDTVVDAIKVTTDKFVFTVANQVDSNILAISGSTTAADNAEAGFLTMSVDTAKAGTLSTTQMSTNLTEATNDHYNGLTIKWVDGVLAGQGSLITDYVGTNGVLTFDALTEAPSATDQFVIM